MADPQIQQIRNIYGEILGIADHLPTASVVNRSVTGLYNNAIDALNKASDNDYTRFKVTKADSVDHSSYHVASVKAKMGSIVARLEQEYGFYKPQRGLAQPATNIVTIHNNNQVSITVIPIQDILETISNDDLRADVEALKEVIQGNKDKRKASSLLNSIQQKSWDVFIALLPVVLEQLGLSQGK